MPNLGSGSQLVMIGAGGGGARFGNGDKGAQPASAVTLVLDSASAALGGRTQHTPCRLLPTEAVRAGEKAVP